MKYYWASFIFSLLILPLTALALEKNGFQIEKPLIPFEQILHGGPPRDGIPSIDRPKFIPKSKATYLKNNDRILGIYHNGVARAYPIRILNWHEIVNDQIQGRPLVVSYCPLCGSGVAFKSKVKNQSLKFGVSGLLYNSDVLLYDRQTNSLWSQLLGKAVSGKLKGTNLTMIPLANTTWEDWKKQFPNTMVLSTNTGFGRDYSRTPYQGYTTSRRVWFPLSNQSNKYHPKEQVIGLKINGKFRAYPFAELSKQGSSLIKEAFAGQQLQIHWNGSHRTGKVLLKNGKEIPTVITYWFAWFAFHPETSIFKAK
ncbi:MAG: hypothetical protein ACI86H_002840 [bacterium]|jgi:hypothetical protein